MSKFSETKSATAAAAYFINNTRNINDTFHIFVRGNIVITVNYASETEAETATTSVIYYIIIINVE